MTNSPWPSPKPFDPEKWLREQEEAKRRAKTTGPHGGARPGAGRPRTESLDAVEYLFLADLVERLDGELHETALVAKLRRIADRVARTGR